MIFLECLFLDLKLTLRCMIFLSLLRGEILNESTSKLYFKSN